MIVGLALALLAPQTVTFEHPCASAKVVLEALGKQIGQDLRVSGTVNDDFVVVRFAGVPVQEALDRLAKTLSATWTKEGEVTYLGRTRPQDVQDFEAEYSEKLRIIQAAIAQPERPAFDASAAERLATQVRDFGAVKSNDDWNRYQPLAVQLPGYRAMLELISLLDLGALVRTSYSPVQFSSMAEKPLPNGADKVIAQLSRDWAVYSAASARIGVPDTDVYQKLAGGAGDLTQKIQLSAHISPENILFMLSVLGETSWQTIGQLSVPFDTGGEVPAWAQSLEARVQASEEAWQSVLPIPADQDNRELASALATNEDADPTLAFAGALLLQAAHERGESLVASLPDSSYSALAKGGLSRDTKLSVALSSLFASRSVKSEEGNGWITVRPTAPYRARYLRLDRQAFQRVCRYVQTNRSLPLDVYADFVATTKRDDTVKLAITLFDCAFPHSAPIPTIGIGNVRLYGLLPPADRERSKREPVVFNGRGDAQNFAVALSLLANSYYEFAQHPAPGPPRPFMEVRDALDSLPKGVVWSISLKSEDFVQPNRPARRRGDWHTVLTIEDYAMNSVWAERDPSRTDIDFTKVALIKGWSLDVAHEDDAHRAGGVAFSHYVDPLAQLRFGSVNDLPTEVRDAVLRKQEEWRKQRGGGQP